jgi:hypothetical protein
MNLNFEIYKGKHFSGLCKDIVKNSENKKDQIDILISELRTLIKTVNDAVIIVPLIKDYYDVGIKNDEQLVKLASVVQRLVAKGEASGEGTDMVLSEIELKQLMEEVITISKNE